MAVSSLASAAAGRNNPFGLPGANSTYGIGGANATGGYQGYQLLNPPQQPAGQQKTPTQTPVVPLPITSATTPGAAGAPTPAAGQFSFNLQTDPALQQVNAMVGLSDQQANAQALKERQQLLLQYGDPTLAASVLGAGDPTAQAAAQNQESDLSQLGRQRDQNVQQFEQQLDPSLTFSGYKIGQEKLLGQAYQDALAKAASGVQSGLDQINGNLNQEIQQNQFQQNNALQQAYANELQMILAGLGGGAGAGAPSGGSSTISGPNAGVYGSPQPYTIGGPAEVAPPTPLVGVDPLSAFAQIRKAAVPGGQTYNG